MRRYKFPQLNVAQTQRLLGFGVLLLYSFMLFALIHRDPTVGFDGILSAVMVALVPTYYGLLFVFRVRRVFHGIRDLGLNMLIGAIAGMMAFIGYLNEGHDLWYASFWSVVIHLVAALISAFIIPIFNSVV